MCALVDFFFFIESPLMSRNRSFIVISNLFLYIQVFLNVLLLNQSFHKNILIKTLLLLLLLLLLLFVPSRWNAQILKIRKLLTP